VRLRRGRRRLISWRPERLTRDRVKTGGQDLEARPIADMTVRHAHGAPTRRPMDVHALAALLHAPLDATQAALALMIGVAGGRLLSEVRLEPIRRVLRGRRPPAPPNHGGPWG
jgi:hypothetical protein